MFQHRRRAGTKRLDASSFQVGLGTQIEVGAFS